MEPGYEVYEYSRRGSVADLHEVLRAGVKPDEFLAYDGSTALVIASRSGHGACVQELLAFVLLLICEPRMAPQCFIMLLVVVVLKLLWLA